MGKFTERPGEHPKTRLMRLMIHLRDTKTLVKDWKHAAKQFEADPQGPDSSALITVTGLIESELTEREVPLCPKCSAPEAARWHSKALHAIPDDDAVLEALTDAAMTHLAPPAAPRTSRARRAAAIRPTCRQAAARHARASA